jgi:hypothetical protein
VTLPGHGDHLNSPPRQFLARAWFTDLRRFRAIAGHFTFVMGNLGGGRPTITPSQPAPCWASPSCRSLSPIVATEASWCGVPATPLGWARPTSTMRGHSCMGPRASACLIPLGRRLPGGVAPASTASAPERCSVGRRTPRPPSSAAMCAWPRSGWFYPAGALGNPVTLPHAIAVPVCAHTPTSGPSTLSSSAASSTSCVPWTTVGLPRWWSFPLRRFLVTPCVASPSMAPNAVSPSTAGPHYNVLTAPSAVPTSSSDVVIISAIGIVTITLTELGAWNGTRLRPRTS